MSWPASLNLTPRPQGIDIYRPWDEVAPFELLGLTPGDDLTFVRVAKRDDETLGGYHMVRLDPLNFEMRALVVRPEHRGEGIGTWLFKHAQALTESKSGRVLHSALAGVDALHRRLGFEPVSGGWRFEVTPE